MTRNRITGRRFHEGSISTDPSRSWQCWWMQTIPYTWVIAGSTISELVKQRLRIGCVRIPRVLCWMRCWHVGDELLEGYAVGTSDVDGADQSVYSDSSSARGTTKRSGVGRIGLMDTRRSQESLRKGSFGLNVMDTIMRHGHEVLERHNEGERFVGIDATVLLEAWDGHDDG